MNRHLILIVTALVGMASAAHAHSWYSKKVDPVFKQSCCGGTDCKEFIAIPGVSLIAETEGYRVILTAAQAMKINPYTVAPINAVVTYDRVQPSEDGNWHICIMSYSRDNERGGIYCLFAPPDT